MQQFLSYLHLRRILMVAEAAAAISWPGVPLPVQFAFSPLIVRRRPKYELLEIELYCNSLAIIAQAISMLWMCTVDRDV